MTIKTRLTFNVILSSVHISVVLGKNIQLVIQFLFRRELCYIILNEQEINNKLTIWTLTIDYLQLDYTNIPTSDTAFRK